MTGIPFAAEIRELRYLTRKAAADYYRDQGGPKPRPTDEEKASAVRAVANGYTQAEVADVLGVHTDTVGQWVRAARRKGAAK